MSAELLARIQFAFTIGFHFLFVPISIGLGVMLVIAERRYYKSGLEIDKASSEMWKKILAATFAVGVATGISMEFAFGTNWADYSRFVGDIFGAPLAAEGLFAFMLESVLLGVLLFGRDRVSKRAYYVSAWLVAIGAHLSAVWIIVANSWQQTPAGYRLVDGLPRLTSFLGAVFNPSFVVRFLHTVAATWVAGAFFVIGICAWYLLKGQHKWMVRRTLGAALAVGLLAAVAMPIIGDQHGKEVWRQQPVKLAAFEGLYKTQDDAPAYLFGWVDTKHQKVTGLAVPGLLSFLASGSTTDEIKGLDASVPADRPPVQIVFQSYHLMVALGIAFVALMLVGGFFHVRNTLESKRWLLWLLVIATPFPIIASEMGWISAEVGRQPWIVQGLLRTASGVSPVVSRGQVVTSLAIFAVLYLLIALAWLRVVGGIIGKGPVLSGSEVGREAQPRAEQPGPAAADSGEAGA